MLNRAFYNAAGVREEDLPFSARSEMLFARIRPFFEKLIFQNAEVLELCCGNGRMSFALEKLGARVYGLDFAEEVVAFAEAYAQKMKSKAKFYVADATDIHLPQKFDLVFLAQNNLAEFSQSDFLNMLACIYAHLKTGGKFLLEFYERLGGETTDVFSVPEKGEFYYRTYGWNATQAESEVRKFFGDVHIECDEIEIRGRKKTRFVIITCR